MTSFFVAETLAPGLPTFDLVEPGVNLVGSGVDWATTFGAVIFWGIVGGLLFFAVYNTALGLILTMAMIAARPRAGASIYQPHATILLPLRGADPDLERGLTALMSQDYPDYTLRVVVDRESDPAWTLVGDVAARTGFAGLERETLALRRDRCSLKCSAMVQLAEGLSERTELVVLADGDMAPHDQWLTELVAPLADSRYGLATGGQWFAPDLGYWGSIVRTSWNAGALVAAYFCRNPWAGSCAIRASVFRQSGLTEMWKTAAVDDGPMRQALKTLKVRFAFIPLLIMTNREDCRFGFCVKYLTRMMTWSRLYEPVFLITILHATLSAGLFFGGLGGTALMVAIARWTEAGLLAGATLAYWGSMTALYAMLDRGASAVAVTRGQRGRRVPWRQIGQVFLMGPVTQAVYAYAAIRAIFTRRVIWRGVEYEVRGPYDVTLVSEHAAPAQAASNLSL